MIQRSNKTLNILDTFLGLNGLELHYRGVAAIITFLKNASFFLRCKSLGKWVILQKRSRGGIDHGCPRWIVSLSPPISYHLGLGSILKLIDPGSRGATLRLSRFITLRSLSTRCLPLPNQIVGLLGADTAAHCQGAGSFQIIHGAQWLLLVDPTLFGSAGCVEWF